jgi:hypothetical protein
LFGVLVIGVGLIFIPLVAGVTANMYLYNAASIIALFPGAVFDGWADSFGHYPYQVYLLLIFATELLFFVVRLGTGSWLPGTISQLTKTITPYRFLLQILRGSFLLNPLSHIWLNWKRKFQVLNFSSRATSMILNAEAQVTKWRVEYHTH